MAMARSIANPDSLSALINILMIASPRVKYLVSRIFSALVQMKLPLELFEEAVNLQMQEPDSLISQLFKKMQP